MVVPTLVAVVVEADRLAKPRDKPIYVSVLPAPSPWDVSKI